MNQPSKRKGWAPKPMHNLVWSLQIFPKNLTTTIIEDIFSWNRRSDFQITQDKPKSSLHATGNSLQGSIKSFCC
uniref:Defective in cullin neddylation protein n=1 Tax=Rhizophora mucronata TaxID=61149 RepID=A0A2P2LHL1_RHIMU